MQMQKIKKCYFFSIYLNLIKNNIWISKNFNYIDNLTIFKILWFFLLVEEGGFVVNHVAA